MYRRRIPKITMFFCAFLLVIVEVFTLFLMYKSSNNSSNLATVDLNKNIINSDIFAIMLEQSDGTYKESSDKVWPTTGYTYNESMSGCIDQNGNKLDGILNYDATNNIATVDTVSTSYCYLYFDLPANNLYDLCKSYNNLSSCMADNYNTNLSNVTNMTSTESGGLYRYQGEASNVQNNYICFGVDTLEDCLGNDYKSGVYDETKFSKYLYRILGINSDGNLKLIKKEALDTAYYWEDIPMINDEDNFPWSDSDLFVGLNGEYFLNNTNYVPTGWADKIATVNWKYGNILVDTSNTPTSESVYLIENAWTNSVDAKIGLMYLHDYFYSKGNDASYYYAGSTTGWIHLKNNDAITNSYIPFSPTTASPTEDEWTIPFWGVVSRLDGGAWFIKPNGGVGYQLAYIEASVRPVFYLLNTLKISGGNGTATNPYLLG